MTFNDFWAMFFIANIISLLFYFFVSNFITLFTEIGKYDK